MATHVFLHVWLELPPSLAGGVDLAILKTELAGQGVNGRGWRLYLDYGDALFSPLSPQWIFENRPAGAIQNAVVWLKLLQACEMDILPPPLLVRSLTEWGMPDNQLALLPPLFFRAAWKACIAVEYAEKSLSDFIAREIVPVARYFFASGDYQRLNHQRLKSGWDALKRHYATPVPKKSLPAGEFCSPIPRVEWGRYRFEALESVNALASEGEAMKNCIGSYGPRLAQQMLIAFSVKNRKSGEREATMTVAEVSAGRWQISEIEGPENSDAGTEIEYAAYAVIRVLEEAYCTVKSVREAIQAMRSRAMHAPSQAVPIANDTCDFSF